MWLVIVDKEKEIVINFGLVQAFMKTINCRQEPCIELSIHDGGMTLIYDLEQKRNEVYEILVKELTDIQIRVGYGKNM